VRWRRRCRPQRGICPGYGARPGAGSGACSSAGTDNGAGPGTRTGAGAHTRADTGTVTRSRPALLRRYFFSDHSSPPVAQSLRLMS
jgi:hypothetical protein